MKTIEIKIYKIDEHPNKEKCYEWIRDNWLDLNQHSVDEIIESIKALSNKIGGTYDYSISQVPDRGENITFDNYDVYDLYMLSADSCPLTGVCWDIDLIEGLKEKNTQKVLNSLHQDTEYIYSDKGLFELCESNEYYFTEEGKIY